METLRDKVPLKKDTWQVPLKIKGAFKNAINDILKAQT